MSDYRARVVNIFFEAAWRRLAEQNERAKGAEAAIKKAHACLLSLANAQRPL